MEGKNGTDNFSGRVQTRVTCGEMLPNGAAIELVLPSSSNRLQLLFWDGQTFQIDFEVRYGDVSHVTCGSPLRCIAVFFAGVRRQND